mgnify:FL=1
MTNFPNGVASFGVPILPGVSNAASVATVGVRAGKVFWVASTYTGGVSNGSYDRPYLTVAAAVTAATANSNETIYVKDGHVETFSAAVTTWAKAGVAIVGLGTKGRRPTFTMDATASQIELSAANQILANLVFNSTIDAVVAVVAISAANVQLLDVEFRDGLVTTEAAIDVLTTAAADNLTLRTRHVGFSAGDAKTDAIQLIGVVNADVHIDFFGLASAAVVQMLTTVCQNISIRGRVSNAATGLNLIIVNAGALQHTFDAVVYDEQCGAYMQKANLTSAVAAFPDVPYQPAFQRERTVISSDDETVGTTIGTVFRVIGQVLVTEVFGEVTTAINNASGSIAIGYGSAGGVGLAAFCSVTTHAADADGTLIVMPLSQTEVALISTDGISRAATVRASTAGIGTRNSWVLGSAAQSDQILTAREGVATAGVTRWTVRYVPLSQGARILPLFPA